MRSTFTLILGVLILPILACGILGRRSEPVASLPPEAVSGQGTGSLATAVFSPGSVTPELPDNVLEEIMFFGGAAPVENGGRHPCEDVPARRITILDAPEREQPLFKVTSITMCGWQAGGTVRISITLPDGQRRTDQVQAGEFGELVYPLAAGYTDLPGRYRYAFIGSGGEQEWALDWTDPESPGVYRHPDQPEKLLLHNYRPGETVRLFIYEKRRDYPLAAYHLLGWQRYTIGPGGRLLVVLEVSDPTTLQFAVFGENETPGEDTWITCYGGGRLQPGDRAWVTAANGADLYAHTDLTPFIFQTPVAGYLPYGTEIVILGNPVCLEDTILWEVSTPQGETGLVAEDWFSGEPQIERGRAPAGIESPEFSCPGALPARLQTGDSALTTVPANLYARPRFSAEEIGDLAPGIKLTILAGPYCVEDSVWYRIEALQGQSGWMTEGDPDGYYLEP